MLRFVSIRVRLVALSLLLVSALIGSNLLLIHQNQLQNSLIAQQASNIDVLVTADNAVASFGNLKYWLTDLTVSQLTLSRQKAEAERIAFERQLRLLDSLIPDSVAGVSNQVTQLINDSIAASEAYREDNRLVGNAMLARGRAHILAVDSKLSSLVSTLRDEATQTTDEALTRSMNGIRLAIIGVGVAVLLSTLFTFSVVRSVVSPLQRLVRVIDEMVSGDMHTAIPSGSRDEFGAMESVLRLFRDSVLQRQRADDKLRRQAQILEELYDAIIAVDTDGKIIEWNAAAERIYGYTREEMIGRTTEVLYGNDDAAAKLRREVRAHVDNGQQWVGRHDSYCKDGQIARVETVVFALTDDSGEPVSRVNVSRDIGAWQRAEQALRDSERRFAAIIENMPATVFLRDLTGKFLIVNHFYADFYGLNHTEIAGKRNIDLFPAPLAEESDQHDRKVIETGDAIEQEVTVILGNGEPATVLSIKFPIFDADGALLSVGGVELDITDRKRSEALLQEANKATAVAERRLSAAVENMSEAIVVYDEYDRLVLCNSRFKEFYGYTDEDVRPGVDYAWLTRLDVERGMVVSDERSRYLKLRDEHRSRLAGTLDVELRDGRWLQIRERQTEESYIVSIQADVTDLKRTEIELLEAKEEAELANQAKSQFLANMSHELRTPLNAVIGITEMLIEDAADDVEKTDPLQRIHGAGTQLLGLINEILDLSKVEAGKMEILASQFDLVELVGAIVHTASSLAKKNANTLIIDAPTALGYCYLDEKRVRQIVLNLVSNACKFSDHSEVRIELYSQTRDTREGVVIAVHDHGIGIDSLQQRQLFTPFSQGDSSTSRRYGGTGLGLAITRHFCHMMGGSIEVDSELGVGSTFLVWLPRSMS